jgi:hypothetical protein
MVTQQPPQAILVFRPGEVIASAPEPADVQQSLSGDSVAWLATLICLGELGFVVHAGV